MPEPIEVPIDEFILPKRGDTVIIRDGREYHGRRALVSSNCHRYGDHIEVFPEFVEGKPIPKHLAVFAHQVEIVPPEEPKDNVTNLFDVDPTSKRWTVEEMLLDALEDVRSGERKANKAIVLFLDDEGGKYLHGYNQAGLRMSECVLLCEMGKTMFKEEME